MTDTKPNVTDAKEESITIRVKDQAGEETLFKVKKHTKMSKILNAYADRKGVASNAIRFLLDGVRVQPEQTPKMLELEDQDQIDVALEQLGGADGQVKPEQTRSNTTTNDAPAAPSNTENKPPSNSSESDAVITIRVKDQTGDETFFKVKPNTKMTKIFKAYADRRGVDTTAMRFLLDGARIQPEQTPKMLELEDQDQIDVALEQVGGGDDVKAEASSSTAPSEVITIRVKDQTGEETFFKVKPHTKMEKIFKAYADRKGVAPTAMRFLLDGARIQPEQTPKMLELEDQDQIDVALEQVGGRKF